MPKGALKLKSATDYVFREDQQSVWITVGNISVYIKREVEGVAVDLYPLNDEASDSIAGCYALFTDAETDAEPNACPECARSFGPNYTGPCEH